MKPNNCTLILLFLLALCTSCNNNPYAKGEEIYVSRCASCHMPDGSGLVGNIPSLTESALAANNANLVCVILNGIKAEPLEMPAQDLEVIPLTNLVNYINHQFKGKTEEVRLDSIKIWIKKCN